MSTRATETGRSRAVPFLVLALVVLALLTSPVRAAEGDPLPLPGSPPVPGTDLSTIEAIDAMIDLFETGTLWTLDERVRLAVLDDLLLEIALLEEIDAFRPPVPNFVIDTHQAFGPWPDTTRDAVIGELMTVDDRLAERKNEVNAQIGPAPALALPLDELPIVQRNRIAAGETGIVDSVPYARALNEILSFGNAETLVARGVRDAPLVADLPIELSNPALPDALVPLWNTATAAGAGTAIVTGTAGPEPDLVPSDTPGIEPAGEIDAEGGDAASTVAVGAAIAAVLGLLAAGAAGHRLRRRSATAKGDAAVTTMIFEAHRRLAPPLDEPEIEAIGRETARSITRADDASIYRRTPEGLRRIGGTVQVVTSALDRVVETAQPLVAVVHDDPAVGSAAVCAVPLVNDGTVESVLVASRASDRPFGDDDRRRLEMLAPALGAALATADTLASYEQLALVDGLTALGNRRRLDGDLETTLGEALASGLPVAFAMIDIDHFKHFNDTHGHEAGDRALRTVARVIAETVRTTDIVYRYGGEEFSVLLPGATDDEATAVAERMRAAVEAAVVDGEEFQPGGRLTISVGVSTLEHGDPGGLKARADKALYEAKARGRNRSVIA